MVYCGAHLSVKDVVSGVPVRKKGNVLVVSRRYADADILCNLLFRCGYQPQWCSDPAQTQSFATAMIGEREIIATILCHCSRPLSQRSATDSDSLLRTLPDHLREKRIIAVTDCTSEDTVVSLLEDGAHYCFSLHDSPRVLQARLEAALRRHGRMANRLLTQGDIRFDLQKRRVTLAGKPIDLSPKEYELACYLFSNRGRVVSNGELMTSIWSLPPIMDTRRIDTAACRVRKKLKLDAAHGWELNRLRRTGYRLVRVESSQLGARTAATVKSSVVAA
jgi:DNA-binding response OmpR family regulator